jgi:hypothetical protein
MMEDQSNIPSFLGVGVNHECQLISDAFKANILANENLHDSFELVSSLLTLQSDNNLSIKFLIPLISALVGALSAFLFNRFHWKMVEKKKKETDLFVKISTLIGELETLSVQYWIKDHNENDDEKEVYLKSKFRLLNKYIRAIDVKAKSIKNELVEFESDTFDLVTGEDFESKKRKASKQKAILITYKFSEIYVSVSRYC